MKLPLINAAAKRLMTDPKYAFMQQGVAKFRAESAWVEESALFDAIRRADGMNMAWWMWPAEIRDRDPSTIAQLRIQHAAAIDVFIAVQYMFNQQWDTVKVCARIVLLTCGLVILFQLIYHLGHPENRLFIL